jgi:uncharacterized protein (UPF0212 family)
MKCPKCNQKIDSVWVVSECSQEGFLKGNKIVEYDTAHDIGKTIRIECTKCGENITLWVLETEE